MTTLADMLAVVPKRSCSFGAWRENLTPTDREMVDKALAEPAWSTSKLRLIFREFNLVVSHETIALHRKGLCGTCNSS